MEQGRVVEAGTHESLIRRDALYRRLYEMQFRDYAVGSPDPAARPPSE